MVKVIHHPLRVGCRKTWTKNDDRAANGYSSARLAFSLACSRALGFTDSWNGTSETVA